MVADGLPIFMEVTAMTVVNSTACMYYGRWCTAKSTQGGICVSCQLEYQHYQLEFLDFKIKFDNELQSELDRRQARLWRM